MNIFIFAYMLKGKKIIVPIALALFALLIGSCVNVQEIKVTSCSVKSITPSGLRSIQGLLALGIDDPASGFMVSDIRGIVKYKDNVIGSYTGGPVEVDGHSSKVYDLPCTATLAKDFSLMELFTLLANKNLEGYTTNISAKVRLKGGIGKTLEFKDVPLNKLLDKVKTD